jgi:hypothetical protein
MGKQSEKATPQNSGMKQKSISSFFAAKPKPRVSPSKKPGGWQQDQLWAAAAVAEQHQPLPHCHMPKHAPLRDPQRTAGAVDGTICHALMSASGIDVHLGMAQSHARG